MLRAPPGRRYVLAPRRAADERRAMEERQRAADERRAMEERQRAADERRAMDERQRAADERRAMDERQRAADNRWTEERHRMRPPASYAFVDPRRCDRGRPLADLCDVPQRTTPVSHGYPTAREGADALWRQGPGSWPHGAVRMTRTQDRGTQTPGVGLVRWPPRAPTEFPSKAELRETNPDAVSKLMNMREDTTRHLRDIAFFCRRDAKTTIHRSWYAGADAWAGSSSALLAKQALLEVAHEEYDAPVEWTYSTEQQTMFAIEEDVENRTCAISGEKLDTHVCLVTGSWWYIGVVHLSGDDAIRHNVEDGSIVKITAADAIVGRDVRARWAEMTRKVVAPVVVTNGAKMKRGASRGAGRGAGRAPLCPSSTSNTQHQRRPSNTESMFGSSGYRKRSHESM
jgi:hypothetical protein